MYRYSISVTQNDDEHATIHLIDMMNRERVHFPVKSCEAGPIAYTLHMLLRSANLSLNPEIEYW